MGGASASSTTLSQFGDERTLEVLGPVTQRSVPGAPKARYPLRRGTIRNHVTRQRRPMVRFFAWEEDLFHSDRTRWHGRETVSQRGGGGADRGHPRGGHHGGRRRMNGGGGGYTQPNHKV